ncbi:hypothetical protein LIA77_10061 [Sarocladium implicatum]|nr:hypothetical protein LIA77_10061 [Sarocladium implicatum]
MGWVVNATAEVNDQSQYPVIIGVCTTLTALSMVVVGGRLRIRSKVRGLASDDHMALLSEVFVVAYASLTIAQTRYGLGLPIALRPEDNIVTYTRVNFAGRPIYQMGISFFKIALLISYLRLLKGTAQKTYRLIVWITIILVFMSHVGCTLSLIFACDPVEKSWNPLKDGKCLPPGPSFTGYAMVTIVSDVAVAVIPLPVLLKLNIQVEKKFGLIGIFALGLFTTMCSIMRYLQINRIQNGDGNSTMLVLWGTIEFNVGNIVSSLPFLAPVFIRKAKEYRSKGSGGSDSSGGRTRSKSYGRGRPTKAHIQLDDFEPTRDGFPCERVKSESEEDILSKCLTNKTASVRAMDDVEFARPRTANSSGEWR